MLFPEEDKAPLQALQCFHVLNCVNGRIGVPRELNNNFSQIKCIYSDHSWLNPDLTQSHSKLLLNHVEAFVVSQQVTSLPNFSHELLAVDLLRCKEMLFSTSSLNICGIFDSMLLDLD